MLSFLSEGVGEVEPWSRSRSRMPRKLVITRQERLKRAAALLVEAPVAEDAYSVGHLSDGFEVVALLVNVVHLSRVRCAQDADSHGVSPIALHQALLGIASISVKSAHSKEIVLKYVAPFRGKHALTTSNLRLQETAAMSGSVGRSTVDVTLQLVREAGGCGVPLYTHDRRNNNEVYTAFVNFPIDLDLLQRMNPQTVRRPHKFDARVIAEPRFGNRRLLTFPKGIIICVGSKGADGMLTTMRSSLPLIEAAKTDTLPAKKKKRRRQE